MTELIARREYTLTTADRTATIVVHLGRPVPFPDDPNDNWYCPWTVDGPDGLWEHYAGGVDALQAVLLAVSGLRADLQLLARRGSLTWLGGDLGLHLVGPAD